MTRADSPTVVVDDAVIVRAVLDGDRDAFRLLVDRELPAVVRTAARILDDVPEAEDVAQEAFVIAYRSLATWRADGPFGAWLSRIAVRLAVRRAVRRRAVPWTQPGHVDDDDEPLLAARAQGADPEHLAVRGEQARDVRRAVAALDEPYREVVALRFFAERSLDEIATITGRPLGTVKTHLRRGLIRLRGGIDAGGPA
ncbi:MAG TPA: sigma-70 family RNA polymerase sigma factor [Candidatus Acidoferrales bacterium]|nr:sigma-70 family RNA polymerase sigma factor [Candidatus Acidoferrales bacterium]